MDKTLDQVMADLKRMGVTVNVARGCGGDHSVTDAIEGAARRAGVYDDPRTGDTGE